MSTTADAPIARLLQAGRTLVGELDTEVVLRRLLETAREITGARYAALGVLDESRRELQRFVVSGIGDEAHHEIGNLPRGRGVLGLLIDDPRPLRLHDIGSHPRSYGFPTGHPRMRSFLGVPILVRGKAWGNLYLTEKPGGEFTEIDEEDVTVLAEWAAIAIDNARQFEASERHSAALERAVQALEATRDIAVAIGGETDLERVLELIVKRGRALIDARAVLIMLRDGQDLVVAAAAGEATATLGQRLPVARSTYGQVLERGRPERIADPGSQLKVGPRTLGIVDAHAALLAPMTHRGAGVGVIAAFDHGREHAQFSEVDAQLLETFAASAANAVTIARSVEADRLRSSMDAAEAERVRWARELHDETLQGLGSLRVLLTGALRRGDPVGLEDAVRETIGHVEREIAALRAIIAELRPAALDQLGLRAAIEVLVERHRDARGLQVDCRLDLPEEATGESDVELHTTVYRLVQESLNNIAKHAHAEHVRLSVRDVEDRVLLEVRDDGVGFDPLVETPGFGLKGMRERVGIAGGTLAISSTPEGTIIRCRLPRRRAVANAQEPAPTAGG
jgi:signal transduction histidine kinase